MTKSVIFFRSEVTDKFTHISMILHKKLITQNKLDKFHTLLNANNCQISRHHFLKIQVMHISSTVVDTLLLFSKLNNQLTMSQHDIYKTILN